MTLYGFFSLLGGVGLFLDGMSKMSSGLKQAAGNAGQYGPIDDVHNTAYFVPHTVCNLPEGTCLVMKTYHSGGGTVMPGHAFYNGDEIWIHGKYWEGGCFLAFDKGEFGYVDAKYVR